MQRPVYAVRVKLKSNSQGLDLYSTDFIVNSMIRCFRLCCTISLNHTVVESRSKVTRAKIKDCTP